jgi:hypothetical protein
MTPAQERMWLLGMFAEVRDGEVCSCGWTSYPQKGIKKWDAHCSKLIKDGLIEAEEGGLMKIMQPGLDALMKPKATGEADGPA